MLFGHFLNSLPSSPIITEYIFKIAISLNKNPYQIEYLKIVQLCDKFSKISAPEKLKFLSLFTKLLKKNFECNKDSIYMLYTYISNIPNDSDFFYDVFYNFFPEQIELEALKGINFLLYSSVISLEEEIIHGLIKLMIQKNLQIEQNSPTEITLIYTLEHAKDPRLRVDIFSLLILRNFRCSQSPSQLKVFEFQETFLLFESIDNALRFSLDSDLAKEIIEFIALNKENVIQYSKELFLDMIIDKVSSGIDNSKFALSAFVDYSNKLSKIIYKRDNFPDWIIKCYGIYPDCLDLLNSLSISIILYQPKLANFNKVRVFLRKISEKGLDALEIYQNVLSSLKLNCTSSLIFLDYMTILEDILPKNIAVYKTQYMAIIKDLYLIAKNFKMVKSSIPSIQSIKMPEIRTLIKQRPKKRKFEEEVYLKEGGCYRLILKYILIGISIENSDEYMKMLEDILISKENSQVEGKYLLFSDIVTFANEKTEASSYYDLYILCELLEILYFCTEAGSLFVDFLLIFIMDFKIYDKLMDFINSITKEDYVNFRILLSESKDCLYPSWRFHYNIENRSKLNELIPNFDAYLSTNITHFSDDHTYYRIFIGKMLEKMVNFNNSLDNSEKLISLLKSKE